MYELLLKPMPWYIAGPLIGLTVPLLLIVGNKTFGISTSFQHICAAVLPKKVVFFNYDWWKQGKWHLQLSFGIILGGVLASFLIPESYAVAISKDTVASLQGLGITDFSGFVPVELFNWESIATIPGFIILVLGGFLIGFGTRYAAGCTSGHAITGLATLQKASLIAVIGFFVGGILSTYFILPNLLN